MSEHKLPQTHRANWYKRVRAVGGVIAISPKEITFTPHKFDSKFGAAKFSLGRDQVVSVERVGRSLLFPRRRMRVRLRDGSSELFLVNHLDQVAKSVATALNVPFEK